MVIPQPETIGNYLVFHAGKDFTGEIFQKKFASQVDRMLSEGKSIAFDLSLVEIINSSILGILVSVKKRAAKDGLEFCIVSPSKTALEVIKIVGIDRLIPIFPTQNSLV